MVHGPCGMFNREMPCTSETGVCNKGFPAEFAEETILPVNKYPTYRRRDNERFTEKRGCALDNRWVVPYNPYLTRRFEAHINVQVCTSIRVVKYLYKYIHKGHDKAAIDIYAADEIKAFLDARYVAPPEACWRLFSFPMSGKSHAVERLPVHSAGMQTVLFEEANPSEAVSTEKETRLTAYFKLVRDGWRAEGKRDLEAPPLYYADVPRWYM